MDENGKKNGRHGDGAGKSGTRERRYLLASNFKFKLFPRFFVHKLRRFYVTGDERRKTQWRGAGEKVEEKKNTNKNESEFAARECRRAEGSNEKPRAKKEKVTMKAEEKSGTASSSSSGGSNIGMNDFVFYSLLFFVTNLIRRLINIKPKWRSFSSIESNACHFGAARFSFSEQ